MTKWVVLAVVVAGCFVGFTLLFKFVLGDGGTSDEGGSVDLSTPTEPSKPKPKPKPRPKPAPKPKPPPRRSAAWPHRVDGGEMAVIDDLLGKRLDIGPVRKVGFGKWLETIGEALDVPVVLDETLSHLADAGVEFGGSGTAWDLLHSLFDALGADLPPDAAVWVDHGRVVVGVGGRSDAGYAAAWALIEGRRLYEKSRAAAALARALDEKTVTLDLEDAEMMEVVAALVEKSGVEVAVEGDDFPEGLKLSLPGREEGLRETVEMVARHFGADWYVDGARLVLCDRGAFEAHQDRVRRRKQLLDEMTAFTVRVEAPADLWAFYKAVSAAEGAPRVYVERGLWERDPKMPKPGRMSIGEAVSSMKGVSCVPVRLPASAGPRVSGAAGGYALVLVSED